MWGPGQASHTNKRHPSDQKLWPFSHVWRTRARATRNSSCKKTTCCCQQLTILFGKIPRVRPNSILEEQRTCFPLALLKQRKGKLLNDYLPPDPSPLMGGGGKGRTSPMHQNTMPFDRNHLMLQGNAPVRLGRRRVSSINQLGSRDLDSPNKCSCWKSDGLPNSPKVSCVCVCQTTRNIKMYFPTNLKKVPSQSGQWP